MVPTGTRRQPGPLSLAVAAILSSAVESAGMAQTTLGAKVGISQSQLSKNLRGERSLTLDELDALCTALRLNIVDVVRQASHTARRS